MIKLSIKKKTKHVIGLFIVMLVILIITSCSNNISTTNSKIDKDMTGFQDFNKKRMNGEKVLIVYGTKGEKDEVAISKAYAELSIANIKEQYRENHEIKSDVEITEGDIKEKHIMLIGNQNTNHFFSKINDYLPIGLNEDSLIVGEQHVGGDNALFQYIIPNPLNKKKYLVVLGAVNSENFPYIWWFFSGKSGGDYTIKLNTKEKYSGKFVKGDTQWTLNNLGENLWEDNFQKEESEHFIFHYSDIDNRTKQNIDIITNERELAYREIADKLGIEIEEKIHYYIFMSQDIMESYRNGDDDFWLGYIYDVYDQNKSDEYKYDIFRVLINQEYNMPQSQFLVKGLYLGLIQRDKYSETEIKEIINSDEYVPLSYLTDFIYDHGYDKEIVDKELASFSKYLINQYGIDKYIVSYNKNKTENVDISLYETYQKDLLELEEEWLEYINKL